MRRLPQTALSEGSSLPTLSSTWGWYRAADPSAARLWPKAPHCTQGSPETALRCCSSVSPAAVPSWPAAAARARARIRQPTLSLRNPSPRREKEDPGRSGAGRIGVVMRRPELWLAARRSGGWSGHSGRQPGRAAAGPAAAGSHARAVHDDLHSMLIPAVRFPSSHPQRPPATVASSVSSSLRLRCDSEGP